MKIIQKCSVCLYIEALGAKNKKKKKICKRQESLITGLQHHDDHGPSLIINRS